MDTLTLSVLLAENRCVLPGQQPAAGAPGSAHGLGHCDSWAQLLRSRCPRLSARARPLWLVGFTDPQPVPQAPRTGSATVTRGLSCSAACGNFPDQGLNLCLRHWQADSWPLSHQGSPAELFIFSHSFKFSFISNYTTPCSVSCRANLVVMSSLQFCLFGKVLTSFLFLKNSFAYSSKMRI